MVENMDRQLVVQAAHSAYLKVYLELIKGPFRLQMSRKFIIKILSFLLVIICSLSIFFDSHEAYAAVYYVAPDGTDGNAGTSAAPWATFDYAMTGLKPGDTLYLKDGLYKKSLKVTVSGAIGKVITLSAVNAGKAIISTSYPTSP